MSNSTMTRNAGTRTTNAYEFDHLLLTNESIIRDNYCSGRDAQRARTATHVQLSGAQRECRSFGFQGRALSLATRRWAYFTHLSSNGQIYHV